MAMSSASTTADHRKRIATYGKKASRTSTNFDWNVDAPSPERPRKQALAVKGKLLKPVGALGVGSTIGALPKTRTKSIKTPATRDVFDVPSDEEMLSPPSPPRTTKHAPRSALKHTAKTVPKQVPKQTASVDEFDVPSSGDEALLPRRRVKMTPQPLRKTEPASKLAGPSKRIQATKQAETASSEVTLAPPIRRINPLQTEQEPKTGERRRIQTVKDLGVEPKAALRAAASVPPITKTHKSLKNAPGLLSKKVTTKPVRDLDIFNVPSSEEDVSVRTLRQPRPAPLPRVKASTISRAASGLKSPGEQIESDDSNSSNKRKRRASITSLTESKEIGNVTEVQKPTVNQRGKKYQKKEGCVSPRHSSLVQTLPLKDAGSIETIINKPKRTRLRTAPGSVRPPVTKMQSSPAKLHGMLAVRSLSKAAPASEMPEVLIEEDMTMYDIPDPATPLVQSARRTAIGSVTPRQKVMFDNLLNDSSPSNTPDMPSVSSLRLTERRPRSLLAGLTRSSSDIPHTTYSRKPRLIDTLVEAVSSSEDEDSESDEETEEDITDIPAVSAPLVASGRTVIDSEPPVDSQVAQSAPLLKNGFKVTYAKQRSYIEESSLEDGLMSIDFDDLAGLGGFGLNKRPQSISEDEEPSQVRGIHELRKQGQNQKFQLEAQSAIDDISGKAGLGVSLRRSAMLDFCTKMADQKYIEQLLDSALGHEFLGSMNSNGEIIFDFASAASVAFILKIEPGYAVLEQIFNSKMMETLIKLLDSHADISRIAKDRKINLSKIGQESVSNVRRLVQNSSFWGEEKPDKVSPQLLAMKTLEMLVLALRKAGSTDALLREDVISKLLDIASPSCNRMKSEKATPQDTTILNLAFSIMEAVSVSKEKQATWSNDVVRRLVEEIPVFFDASGASPIKLAIRLCMNLTNNKPKACDAFAGPAFVRPLVKSIGQRFTLLVGELEEEQRNEVLEGLILSLGAMINLAEFSDQARASVVVGDDSLVGALVRIFLEGSERAAQVRSFSPFIS
jgi:hypothetical protein